MAMRSNGEIRAKYHSESLDRSRNYSPSPAVYENQLNSETDRTNSWLKILAIAQLVLSGVLLICGIVTASMGIHMLMYELASLNLVGASAWAPVLSLIAAALGFGAFRSDSENRRRLLIAHFVMCIISVMGLCASIVISCISLNYAAGFRLTMVFLLHLFILVGSLASMIAHIVSCALSGGQICKDSQGISVPAQSPEAFRRDQQEMWSTEPPRRHLPKRRSFDDFEWDQSKRITPRQEPPKKEIVRTEPKKTKPPSNSLQVDQAQYQYQYHIDHRQNEEHYHVESFALSQSQERPANVIRLEPAEGRLEELHYVTAQERPSNTLLRTGELQFITPIVLDQVEIEVDQILMYIPGKKRDSY